MVHGLFHLVLLRLSSWLNREATLKMRRKEAIALMIVFALASMAFATGNACLRSGIEDDRYFVSKILDASNLVFNKDVKATTFIFNLSAGDSLKINCEDCAVMMSNGAANGHLGLRLKYAGADRGLDKSQFGRWLGVDGRGGKVAVVFERDGLGEKWLAVKSLTVLRKSAGLASDQGGVALGLLEVNQLCLRMLNPKPGIPPTTFHASFRAQDSYQVKLSSSFGTPTAPVLGAVYQKGEEFAKKPLAIGEISPVPASGGDEIVWLGFEFAETPSAKGLDCYHINIDRIPLHSAGEASTQSR